MIGRYCDGVLPKPGDRTSEDTNMLDQATGAMETIRRHMDNQSFHEALEAIWVVVRAGNAYVDQQACWST